MSIFLIAFLVIGCVTTEGSIHKQGDLEVIGGQIEIGCDEGVFRVSGCSATSTGQPITRFVYQVGVDMNENGVLEPEERLLDIDNPNPAPNASAAEITSQVPDGKRVIVHTEIYQGGEKPVYVQTLQSS